MVTYDECISFVKISKTKWTFNKYKPYLNPEASVHTFVSFGATESQGDFVHIKKELSGDLFFFVSATAFKTFP